MDGPCPDGDILRRFALGFPVDNHGSVAQHIAACPSCAVKVSDETDGFVDAVRDGVSRDSGLPVDADDLVHQFIIGERVGSDDSILVVRPIGQGGMGQVWQAYHCGLDQFVALKVCRVDRDQGERRGIEAEAKAAARVRHPNIVTVQNVFTHNDCPVVTMDFIDGMTLNERITLGASNETTVLQWVKSLTSAVDALHEVGVIHGDIKPSNLLIDHRDQIFVTDFGISSALSQGPTRLSGGTPGFVAPEQTEGFGSFQTDIYSIGRVIEFLLGALAADDAGRPSGCRASLSVVSGRCTKEDPMDRYSSCAELAADLPLDPPVRPLSGRWHNLVTSTVAGILLVAGGFCAGGFWVQQRAVVSSTAHESSSVRRDLQARAFARSVFEISHACGVYLPSEHARDPIHSEAQLPPESEGEFWIRGLHLVDITSEDVRSVLSTDEGQEVEMIVVERIRGGLSRETLHDIVAITPLNSVYVTGCGIGDEGVEILASKPGIHSLGFVNDVNITDQAIEYLAASPAIDSIDVRLTSITDEGLLRLLDVPHIRTITLTKTDQYDDVVTALLDQHKAVVWTD